jgi:anti-anti-sigma regulatory factor
MLMTLSKSDHGYTVLRLRGKLNARTYVPTRDAVIKAALDNPTAVIIDVNDLEVPDESSWAVFTSARWHTQHLPQVALALACGDPAVHQRLERMSISHYVPVFTGVAAATRAIREGLCRNRRHARTYVAEHEFGLRVAESFMRHHLAQWSMQCHLPVALTVATVFVENALRHAKGGCDLRLETLDEDVLIAVSDSSTVPAIRREDGGMPRGLDIVDAICRHWGSTATATGKSVWARVRPEDSITGIDRLIRREVYAG